MSRRSTATDNWTRLAVFLLLGFWLVGKPFAYVGGPLGIALFFNRALIHDWYAALTRRTALSGLLWTLLLSVMYGIGEVVYGTVLGNSPLVALRILAFNLFPFFLFLGIWAGVRQPNFVRRFIQFNAWLTTIGAPVYFLFLQKHNIVIPGIGSGSNTLLGLFCFERNLTFFWLPIAVCSFMTIANQIRADWLGFGIALVIWAVATKKIGRVAAIAGGIVALLLIGFIADVRIPAMPGRGGEISARDTVGRAMSSINPELAREYSKDSGSYNGTVYWRQTWWAAIRSAVSENPTTLLFGLGYGYPINELGPGDLKNSSDIVTPHSIIYFTLCFSGCIGVCIFFTLQANILLLLWRTYKRTGQIFGFVSYIATLVGACFGNLFESPQMAIPVYLFIGMCIGPLFIARVVTRERVDPSRQLVRMNRSPKLEPRRVTAQV
ncbi:MAG TPA: O-antigen ligase family protein [Edaphobacter sp.]|nr:O-antigen ligase family protein [Edaphobacter sp.]